MEDLRDMFARWAKIFDKFPQPRDKGLILSALLDYIVSGTEPELRYTLDMAYTALASDFDSSRARYASCARAYAQVINNFLNSSSPLKGREEELFLKEKKEKKEKEKTGSVGLERTDPEKKEKKFGDTENFGAPYLEDVVNFFAETGRSEENARAFYRYNSERKWTALKDTSWTTLAAGWRDSQGATPATAQVNGAEPSPAQATDEPAELSNEAKIRTYRFGGMTFDEFKNAAPNLAGVYIYHATPAWRHVLEYTPPEKRAEYVFIQLVEGDYKTYDGRPPFKNFAQWRDAETEAIGKFRRENLVHGMNMGEFIDWWCDCSNAVGAETMPELKELIGRSGGRAGFEVYKFFRGRPEAFEEFYAAELRWREDHPYEC